MQFLKRGGKYLALTYLEDGIPFAISRSHIPKHRVENRKTAVNKPARLLCYFKCIYKQNSPKLLANVKNREKRAQLARPSHLLLPCVKGQKVKLQIAIDRDLM